MYQHLSGRLLFIMRRLFWVVCATVLSLAMPVAAQNIHLCYETMEYRPYTLGADQVPTGNRGSIVEKVAEAITEAGLNPVFYRRPWNRCIKDLQSGKADGIFPVIWMKEREQWGKFPFDAEGKLDKQRTIRQASYRVFVPKARKTDWDGKNFSNLSSGIVAPYGYVVYHKLKAQGALNPINTEIERGLKMLALNRIDGYVIEEQVAQRIIERRNWQSKIKMLPIPYHVSDFYLLLSNPYYRDNTQDAEKIWSSFK